MFIFFCIYIFFVSGRGHEVQYYIDIQMMFDRFMLNEDIESMDYKKESDYKTLCQLEMLKSQIISSESPDPREIKAIVETISKISTDLNIKTTQKKEEENNSQKYLIGLTTKWIEDVKQEPILRIQDYLGEDYTDTDFERMIRCFFTSPLLDGFNKPNPFKAEWDQERKKYEPTEDEIDFSKTISFNDNDGDGSDGEF